MYLGKDGATLTGHGPYGTLVSFHDAHDIIVQNLTWKGGGIFMERTGANSQNLVIDNNVFSLGTSCSMSNNCNRTAIYFTTTVEEMKITNNLFTDFTLDNFGYGIFGYCYKGLTVANNEFIAIPAGMHVDAQGAPGECGPGLFEQNYFSAIGKSASAPGIGPGMELQSAPDHVTLQDNWFEHPSLSTVYTDNEYSYAFTVPLDSSTNTEIRRNTVIAPERPDGTGCRIGFEVGGFNTTIEENYLNGINAAIADTDGDGTASNVHKVVVQNNHIEDALQSVQWAFPSAGDVLVQTNNGPNVMLSWDMSRGRPYRNKRYPGT
jgi:hypothetical protein